MQDLLEQVTNILDKTKTIGSDDSTAFYKELQHYFDSKEKLTGTEGEKSRKHVPSQREFWVRYCPVLDSSFMTDRR